MLNNYSPPPFELNKRETQEFKKWYEALSYLLNFEPPLNEITYSFRISSLGTSVEVAYKHTDGTSYIRNITDYDSW